MTTVGEEAVSAREAEVLGALADHLTNAQIARRLHISVRTVESHVSSLLRKLGAADRHQLAGHGAATPATPGFTGLPNRWTTFVGRATEIEAIVDALRESRMITLLGPGGIGKTTLATVVAEQVSPRFDGGGAFVDLVPVSPEFLVQAVAAALGVTERPQEPLDLIIHERLRQGRTILVLDNCEHVLATAASFARGVLAACPDAVVLATSRERLGIAGERLVPVPPMAVTGSGGGDTGSEAEALFVDRAMGGVELETDRAMIADICRHLDGMPLAIELAAARSLSLGVDGLLAGLDDHLRLLSSGHTGRHQSLRAVIDWSHDLLDAGERAVFRRLGIFAGAFDLTAVADVACDGDLAAASDGVGRLTDKSLLVHVREGSRSRWRMLDTVHAYAREQLDTSGERDKVSHLHLRWAAATAADLEGRLEEPQWEGRFDAVADDLRAALSDAAAGGDRAGYDLALTLAHLSYARRFLVEARSHYEAAVVLAPDEPAAVAALRVAADAAFAEMRGDLAFAMLMTASERAAAHGDAVTAAVSLADAAAIGGRAPATFVDPPAHEDLVVLVERARALTTGEDLEVAAHIAIAGAWNGRPGVTEPDPALADQALRLARRLDDPVLISGALDAVAAAELAAGRYKQAARLSAARLELLDRMGRHDPHVGGEVADIFHMAMEAAMTAGQLDAALAAAHRAHDDSLDQGLPHFAATHLVIPLALRGAFDESLVQAEVMRTGWERTGRPAAGWMAPSFFAAALVHGVRGDDAARRRWWELAEIISFQSMTNSFSLFTEPRIALHLGDIERAHTAVTRADALSAGQYQSYAAAIGVEVMVVADAPDAEQRLSEAVALGLENDFVAACLLRAAGRLHDDRAELEAAVSMWEAIGARFERACTLVLLPSRRREGAAELAALGCAVPPV